MRARASRVWSVLALLGISAGTAGAQAPVCNQIRAEMAQLGQGGGPGAGRARSELARVRLALQQNDCNRSGFLFFANRPPVCAPLRAQADQLEGQIRQSEGGANPRRAQLAAALERYGCLGPQPQQAQRGVIFAAPNEPSLFDRLFGPGAQRQQDPEIRLYEQAIDPEEPGEKREKLGGRMAICVRTCDGFYFPVNFEGLSARDDYADVCQSLCPAAETQVFFMPLGADVERAATRDGTPYMSLPAAKKYQSTRDPACICKQPTQTWASAMRGIEDVVEARKGDIVVTEEQAQALSRPKGLPVAPERKGKKGEAARPAPKTAEAEPPEGLPDAALPTGGSASAGIGPKIVRDQPVTEDGGVREQTTDSQRVRRSIRNVAPQLTVKEPRIDLRGAARP